MWQKKGKNRKTHLHREIIPENIFMKIFLLTRSDDKNSVGPTGKVYAADIHPLAIKEMRKKADKKRIKNIHIIATDCETKLPDASIDFVLLFYVLHEFKNPDSIIRA